MDRRARPRPTHAEALQTRVHFRNSPRQTALGARHGEASPNDTSWTGGPDVRSILLMFLGVPIPVILLLAFCTHHF
jgi:hypothetical protein